MHASFKTGHSRRTPGGMRAQSQAPTAVRAGLRTGDPQGRAQGPQLHQRAAGAHTDAAPEAERVPAGAQRPKIYDKRTETRITTFEGGRLRGSKLELSIFYFYNPNTI